jgi:curved DNA-binding protein
MGVKYKDYYQVLGVPQHADEAAIRKAYRKLARQTHPDVSKAPDAKARFQEISEAYEVLGDPEKRRRYDQLGAGWQPGQEFTPPHGSENIHFAFNRGGPGVRFSGRSGFSDFFESLFGDMLGGQGPGFRSPEDGGAQTQRRTHDEADLTLTLEEAFLGGVKHIQFRSEEGAAPKNCELRIPPGIRDGARLRLRGRGRHGDLLIRIAIAPHARFKVDGADLEADLPVSPPDAVLGATVGLQLIDGRATLRIPPGTPAGRKFRLAGKGLNRPGGGRGDLYAVVRIDVPKQLSAKERELYGQLARLTKKTTR